MEKLSFHRIILNNGHPHKVKPYRTNLAIYKYYLLDKKESEN